MSKVYLAIPRALDDLQGHVSEDGRIYRSKFGPDEYLGKVDLSSGKIYESQFGPDKKVGYVDLESGKVYLSKLGLDEYIGRVDKNGRIHRHVPMGADDYIGNVEQFVSYAHSAGAMLLLILPALEEKD
jgi:hypothetical protein